jgi:hypothetical protein
MTATLAPPSNGHAPSLLGRAVATGQPRRRLAAVGRALARGWGAVRPVALSVAALGCGVGAAATVATWAGLTAAMVGLLLLEWRLSG